LRGELRVGAILRFCPSVEEILGSPEGVLLESVKGLGNMSWHGDVNGSVGVVPIDGHD
jgi:hypothetical protein